jgi:hypothetical protein
MMGSHRFGEIESGVPRISRSLPTQRLRSLEQAGLIERRTESAGQPPNYHLTPAGQDLFSVIELLGEWGQRWVTSDIGPDDLDPSLLMWDMQRRISWDEVPDRRIVVQFDFSGLREERFWLLLEGREASVCKEDHGFEPDLLVEADTMCLHRVWLGQIDLAATLRRGQIRLHGSRDLVRAFPRWLKLGYFAYVRPQNAA